MRDGKSDPRDTLGTLAKAIRTVLEKTPGSSHDLFDELSLFVKLQTWDTTFSPVSFDAVDAYFSSQKNAS